MVTLDINVNKELTGTCVGLVYPAEFPKALDVFFLSALLKIM